MDHVIDFYPTNREERRWGNNKAVSTDGVDSAISEMAWQEIWAKDANELNGLP